jgi:exopolysaccharide biosynthesis polyprenyl glycosylphosphotransferase
VSMIDGRMETLVAPIALFTPLAAKATGLYDRDAARLGKSTLDQAPQLLQLATLVMFGTWLISPAVTGRVFDAHSVFGGWLLLNVALIGGRTIARTGAANLTEPERCLFIGPQKDASRFREKLAQDRTTNAEIVAQVDFDAADDDVLIVADARALVDQLGIERVIIAPKTPGGPHVLELVRAFEASGVRVTMIPALLQAFGSAVEFDEVHGMALLGMRSFRLTNSSRLVKQAFDRISATLVLVLAGPFMAVVAIFVKLDSPGPALFTQRRIGQGGQQILVYKFRTMVVDAAERKADLLADNQAADGFFTMVGDPRITRVGRILRKTSLDELPQLFNVLRGEMSLVGPRPLIPEEDARVVGWHRRRLDLMPGMTGHWQVLGSSRVPMLEMVAIDYLYVANWSLWADIKLLLRTIPYVLLRRSM